MGGNFAYIFLRRQAYSWKRKYIRGVVFAATPWGGNFKFMYDYVYEDDFAADLIPIFREAERSYSSLAFLLPNARIWSDTPLILTPTTNYTSLNMGEFLTTVTRPEVYHMWLDTRHLLDPFVHPQVDIWCIPGSGYATPVQMILHSDTDWSKREIIHSIGDGFVNIESALGCLEWFQYSHNFYFKVLHSSHLGMIRESNSVQYFAQLITSIA